jgi:Glycosyltransferase family 92
MTDAMSLLTRSKDLLRRTMRMPIGIAKRRMTERLQADGIHELAVCAIFREEAPFLDEWISFHVGVGATHFYLYNNFSTDHFNDVLQPWIARGIVTLIEWPVPVGQFSAYRDCIKRTRRSCRWVAFIDIDEFLFSPQTIDIRTILRRYQDLPGLEVWQAFYGSGGHDARPQMPVTEAYLKRAPLMRTTVKTIADPRQVYKVGVHQFKYWWGDALDPARRNVVKHQEPVLDLLRINHYWSRSMEDLRTKIARNDASTPVPRDPEWHFGFERGLNAETDETILPVARRIREAAGQAR